MGSYQASKEANRLLAGYFSRHKEWKDITVLSCHPGDCTSGVSLGLGFDNDRSDARAKSCSDTPLHCATAKDLKTGTFWQNSRAKNCSWTKDKKRGAQVAALCDSLTPKPKTAL